MLTDKKNKAKDSLICEKIVGSIDSKEMIKRLLRDSELTLNKAANMVRVFEVPRIQVSGQKGKTAADSILKSKVWSISDQGQHSSQNIQRKCYYYKNTEKTGLSSISKSS